MTELILMVGQAGSGKTTRAKELAAALPAVRLTPDEWMRPLFADPDAGGTRAVLEGRLIATAVEVLTTGTSAILDFGFWRRDERRALAWLAGTVGARTRAVHLPIDRAEQTERMDRRRRESSGSAWPVTQDDLDAWRERFEAPDADELTGRYPADGEEAGWRAWIERKWPTALSAD